MQNRMAMEPDNIDASCWVAFEELLGCVGVKAGQLPFDLRNRADAAKNRSQSLAKRFPVRDRQGGAGYHPLLTIGLNHRGVDPIERSTAHQPERVPHLWRLLWPRLGAYVR